jgi:hypothetical protein
MAKLFPGKCKGPKHILRGSDIKKLEHTRHNILEHLPYERPVPTCSYLCVTTVFRRTVVGNLGVPTITCK